MNIAIIIPFRDRGRDSYRAANLKRVNEMWSNYHLEPTVVSDGRTGNAQFNRSAAYNFGAAYCEDAEVLVYTESDMLIDAAQIYSGCEMALAETGLVVPFTEYRYLSEEDSVQVRGGAHPEEFTPESVIPNGRSIGAINIISRATLEAVGQWDEVPEGSWYDDTMMERAFSICAGPTRWVDGPAWHLYHLPGWKGAHLTAEDRAATRRNRSRWEKYKRANTPERIRQLTRGEA